MDKIWENEIDFKLTKAYIDNMKEAELINDDEYRQLITLLLTGKSPCVSELLVDEYPF